MGFHLQDDARMGGNQKLTWILSMSGSIVWSWNPPISTHLGSNMCIVEPSEKPPLHKHGRSLVLSPPIPGECLRGTIPEIEAWGERPHGFWKAQECEHPRGRMIHGIHGAHGTPVLQFGDPVDPYKKNLHSKIIQKPGKPEALRLPWLIQVVAIYGGL